MKIHTICVCGAGTMGSGIAQVAAISGFSTILFDVNAAILTKAKLSIERSLDLLVEKGKLNMTDKRAAMDRVTFTNQIADCKAELCIEAIIEKPEAKIELFNKLADLNRQDTILATNTSSLSIETIAANVKNPERLIGMHFFNPAPLMKLVEIVNTKATAASTTTTMVNLAKEMNKTPVVSKDSPGFIVNRVARPFYIESLRLVEEGQVNFAQADALMEATGFKMGPFKLMDLIGNDINYAVSCSVYELLQKPDRLQPSPIQKEKVDRGEFGKKSGKGYYNYD